MTKDNKIRPLFFLLCEKTITDQDSNNMSAMNITEQINVAVSKNQEEARKAIQEKSFISVPVKLTLLSAWDFDKVPNAFSLELKISDSNGKNLVDDKKNIEVNDRSKRRQRVNLIMQAFPVSTEGTYTIEETLTAGEITSIQRTYIDIRAPFLNE